MDERISLAQLAVIMHLQEYAESKGEKYCSLDRLSGEIADEIMADKDKYNEFKANVAKTIRDIESIAKQKEVNNEK